MSDRRTRSIYFRCSSCGIICEHIHLMEAHEAAQGIEGAICARCNSVIRPYRVEGLLCLYCNREECLCSDNRDRGAARTNGRSGAGYWYYVNTDDDDNVDEGYVEDFRDTNNNYWNIFYLVMILFMSLALIIADLSRSYFRNYKFRLV